MSAVVFRGSMDNCHLGIDWVLLGPGLNLYACVAKKKKKNEQMQIFILAVVGPRDEQRDTFEHRRKQVRVDG